MRAKGEGRGRGWAGVFGRGNTARRARARFWGLVCCEYRQ